MRPNLRLRRKKFTAPWQGAGAVNSKELPASGPAPGNSDNG